MLVAGGENTATRLVGFMTNCLLLLYQVFVLVPLSNFKLKKLAF